MIKIMAFLAFLVTWNLGAAQDGSLDRAADDVMAAPPNFNGVWLSAPGAAGGEQFAEMAGPEPPQLTAEALRIREEYDLFVDDPAYRCSPSSIISGDGVSVQSELPK